MPCPAGCVAIKKAELKQLLVILLELQKEKIRLSKAHKYDDIPSAYDEAIKRIQGV